MAKRVDHEVLDEMVAKLRRTELELDDQLRRNAEMRQRITEMDSNIEKTRALVDSQRSEIADIYRSQGRAVPDELKPRSKS